jgi:hypothetical protein
VLAVKTKEQALAVADALTAPAEAERRRQVEARQLQWFGKIPALSAVPEADRSAVLEVAQRYAGRRWYVYAFRRWCSSSRRDSADCPEEGRSLWRRIDSRENGRQRKVRRPPEA